MEKTVISRKEMSHPRVGANSSKASPSDISQEPKIYFNSDTNGQHSGFDIFEKNSGKKESEKEILETLISKQIMITAEYILGSLKKVVDL